MTTAIQVIFSNPVEGREDEFNEWYDNVHLHEVLAIEGMVTAQRYTLCDAEITRDPRLPAPSHRYLTIYEMEGDVDTIMGRVSEAAMSGAMYMSESLDLGNVAMSFWAPHGPKLVK